MYDNFTIVKWKRLEFEVYSHIPLPIFLPNLSNHIGVRTIYKVDKKFTINYDIWKKSPKEWTGSSK